MFPQRNFRVHARKNNMRSIILTRSGCIKQLIVLLYQSVSPVRFLPYPFSKSIFDHLLLLLRQSRILGIQHALLLAIRILYGIVYTHVAQVQRILQNFIGIRP